MKGGSFKKRNSKRPQNAAKNKAKSSTPSPKQSRTADKANSVKVKKREFFLLACFTFALLFMTWRVGFITFVKGETYKKMAYENQTMKRKINPKRGTIYDRNGKGLAISASVDTVSVNPKELRSVLENNQDKLTDIAAHLAQLLDMDPQDVLKKFNMDSRFEYIKRKIERDVGTQVMEYIASIDIGSIYVDEDSKRYYPNGKLASHVLGFTGVDDQGLNGIEMRLDSTLKGVPGKIMNEVDVLGRQISFSKERYVDAIDGYDVYLTIDETIQHFTEKALDQAILDYDLKRGATAIVMDPYTGEILAMSSKPDFDPNIPDAKPDFVTSEDWAGFKDQEDAQVLWQTVFRNKAVMDTYEPGSTFKAVTAAAAIEEGLVTVDTPEFCKPISMAGHTIDCWRKGGHGAEDFLHAVYNSCNPVFVDIGLELGIEKFYKYVKMFGFMDRTGIDIAGEPTTEEYKNLWHKDPKEIDLAVSSFGQRFQISPIQLITAYGAIANGGSLMKPVLVKQITDSDGNVIKNFEPQVVRKVISEQTAQTLRGILEGVVSEGTGKNAYISGYRVAGKTGTSQTLTTETDGRYIVSFMAIAPADKPRICVLVAFDHPQVATNLRTGGLLAAPVAGKLCEEILEYLQVERVYSEKDKVNLAQEVYVPSVVGLQVKDAVKKLTSFGLKYSVDGSDTSETAVVQDQTPKADFSVPQNSTVILYTDKGSTQTMVSMPNVINKTVAEATEALQAVGLNIRVRGDGTATTQQYEAGEEIEKGEIVEVSFVQMVSD